MIVKCNPPLEVVEMFHLLEISPIVPMKFPSSPIVVLNSKASSFVWINIVKLVFHPAGDKQFSHAVAMKIYFCSCLQI